MKKFFKWLFVSPIIFFGLYLIGLCSIDFREQFIKNTTRILEVMCRELERSL